MELQNNFIKHDEHGFFEAIDRSLMEIMDGALSATGGGFLDGICGKLTANINTACNNAACDNTGCFNSDCDGNINGICSPIF